MNRDDVLSLLRVTTGTLSTPRWQELTDEPPGAELIQELLTHYREELAADRPTPLVIWLPGWLLRSAATDPATHTALLTGLRRPDAERAQAAAAVALGRCGALATQQVQQLLAGEPDGDLKAMYYVVLLRALTHAGPGSEQANELAVWAVDRLHREIDIAATLGPAMADGLGPLWLLALARAPTAATLFLAAQKSELALPRADLAALQAFLDRRTLPIGFGSWLDEANAIMIDTWDPTPRPSPMPRPRATGVPHVAASQPGRNDPCPCGSGKKYKKCCGACCDRA